MRVYRTDAVNGNAGPLTMRVILSDAVNGIAGAMVSGLPLRSCMNIVYSVLSIDYCI